ncbi:cyclophilin-like protein, putative, partial [Trypanosoma cruzi marinkellei]
MEENDTGSNGSQRRGGGEKGKGLADAYVFAFTVFVPFSTFFFFPSFFFSCVCA